MSSKFLTTLLASAAILVLNTACAEPDGKAGENIEAASTDTASTETASTEAKSTEGTPIESAPVDAASPPKEAAQRWTDAMHIPVDGSSLEAFNESLEKIKAQAKENEYTTLTNAIDYMVIYDLAAKRDRAKVAANLDGLTGAEIVDKVHWRKGR